MLHKGITLIKTIFRKVFVNVILYYIKVYIIVAFVFCISRIEKVNVLDTILCWFIRMYINIHI